jgi:hypothetical protein
MTIDHSRLHRDVDRLSTPTIDFAFYGRVSTEDNQDPESSRHWQLTRANALIVPRGGRIVAQYFDIGQSRSLPWQRRDEANRLLDAVRDPHRGFTAVVVGEPHRAFYGNQFGHGFCSRALVRTPFTPDCWQRVPAGQPPAERLRSGPAYEGMARIAFLLLARSGRTHFWQPDLLAE